MTYFFGIALMLLSFGSAFCVAGFSWADGHLTEPKQKRLASAIALILIPVTVLLGVGAGWALFH